VAGNTIDDVSDAPRGDPPKPMIVVLSPNGEPAFAVPPSWPAHLGRTLVAGALTRELDDDRMSREHATVHREQHGWRIVDRGSHNGTFVDGERISGEVTRGKDAIVRLGRTLFVLLADGRGHEEVASDAAAARGDGPVVGPELTRCYDEIRLHSGDDAILVHGESGTGKELAARLYHDAGPRRGGQFVAINCAAMPEGLAERLLFGARRGAFSGATDATGYIQAAHGGTLFLDEVADLDAAVQAKLLRVLDAREVTPIGATQAVKVELGVVAACHQELRQAVASRAFRDDLYYRLARTTVYLPALRERKIDIARLVGRDLAAVDAALLPHSKLIETCCIRPWPGNIRELRAAVRHAAIRARAEERTIVRVEDLPDDAGLPIAIDSAAADAAPPAAASPDRAAVEAALARAGGVISVAARTLGLHRTQLYRLIDKLGITRDP
jgi:DNA-binding NtrC family response regulator